jgi:hypothetical protein
MDTTLPIVMVSATDLDDGMPCIGVCCPLALAIRRVVRDDVYVAARAYYAQIGDDQVVLPDVAGDFREEFNRGGPVDVPLSFPMDIPA